MKAIWKYPLQEKTCQSITMPADAQILTAQMQGDTPVLWALVDESEKQVSTRNIEVHGTGHSIEEVRGTSLSHIATLQLSGGALIFHVFERVKQ